MAIGVLHFVCAGIRWESMQKLLQEGDYTAEKKKKHVKFEPVATVYWLAVTGLYLGCSFVSNAWGKSWIIWPVAGVLYAVVSTIYSMCARRE